jgi:hypothetical protein
LFGLFNYPHEVGPDGTHEIDIEFAKWSNPDAKTGNYTVWPTLKKLSRGVKRFSMELGGAYTTHRFIWDKTSVGFQSLNATGMMTAISLGVGCMGLQSQVNT